MHGESVLKMFGKYTKKIWCMHSEICQKYSKGILKCAKGMEHAYQNKIEHTKGIARYSKSTAKGIAEYNKRIVKWEGDTIKCGKNTPTPLKADLPKIGPRGFWDPLLVGIYF